MRKLVMIFGMLLVGCAAPSIGHKVPTIPVARPGDTDACEAAARPGVEDRDLVYAGCMLSRGYRVSIPLGEGPGGGLPAAYVNVEATRPVAGDASDALVECRRAAQATVSGTARAVNVWLGSLGAATNSTPKMERVFEECIGPRGYTSSRWQPS